MKKGAFLDRDGVVNRSLLVEGVPTPPSSVADVEIHDGVVEAIQKHKAHNFVPVVVTNQPDVARGNSTMAEIVLINKHIGQVTGIEHFYTCIHEDSDRCACRKPAPGLIYQASKELDLDLSYSFMVGDRWRDVAASQAAGCSTFFIDYSYSEPRPMQPFTKVSSLLEATKIVLGEFDGNT